MKASILDLRRRTSEVVRALDRNESVVLLHRGKEKGVIVPSVRRRARTSVKEHAAFGMWRDRPGLENPAAFVRAMRMKGRHAL